LLVAISDRLYTLCVCPRVSASVAVATTTLLLGLVGSPPALGGISPSEALVELNAWRAEDGVPLVGSMEPTMSEGCHLHDAYEALNNIFVAHYEIDSLLGYTDLGSAAASGSDLTVGEGGPRAEFEWTAYHRMQLLNPKMYLSWFDASNDRTCVGIGYGGSVTLEDGVTIAIPGARNPTKPPVFTEYPWPPNGHTGVPTAFASGNESPDPAALVPGVPTWVGPPLTVQFAGPNEVAAQVYLSEATLVPDGGPAVAVVGQDWTNGASEGLVVVPVKPLLPFTWYTAHASGHVEEAGVTRMIDTTWRFQTGANVEPAEGEQGPEEEAKVASTGVISLDGSTIDVQSGGKSAVKLTCTGTGTCSGKLTLTVRTTTGKGKKRHTKTQTIGAATFSIAAGKSETVTLTFNGTGRALLRAAHGHLSATLTILKASPSPSNTQTHRVHLAQQKTKAKKSKK
jgi:hypothetical protein